MMLLLVTPIALFFVVLDAFQAGEIRAIAHLRKLTWVALAGALAASAWIAYSVLYEGPSEMHVSNAVILTPFLFLWLPLIHIWFVRNDELA
jgi:cytochrome bd-type quinol oxidase subunit 2